MTQAIHIRKASGETEPFNAEKLERSLRSAGAAEDFIREVSDDIRHWIYPGVSTKMIYSRAFRLLRRKKTHPALRYKLKQALLDLGPTGYPFEHLIGRLFSKQGYQVEVGLLVDGFSVKHEMDVVATRPPTQHLVECKHSSDKGRQVGIQVPLYVRARVDDIVRLREKEEIYRGFGFLAWVVSNTRFSEDSIRYAGLNDMHLLAWDYPAGNGLKERLENEKLYPVTLLDNLLKKEKQQLMDLGVVTCGQLLEDFSVTDRFELRNPKLRKLMEELEALAD
jgi:hypothetical protein